MWHVDQPRYDTWTYVEKHMDLKGTRAPLHESPSRNLDLFENLGIWDFPKCTLWKVLFFWIRYHTYTWYTPGATCGLCHMDSNYSDTPNMELSSGTATHQASGHLGFLEMSFIGKVGSGFSGSRTIDRSEITDKTLGHVTDGKTNEWDLMISQSNE